MRKFLTRVTAMLMTVAISAACSVTPAMAASVSDVKVSSTYSKVTVASQVKTSCEVTYSEWDASSGAFEEVSTKTLGGGSKVTFKASEGTKYKVSLDDGGRRAYYSSTTPYKAVKADDEVLDAMKMTVLRHKSSVTLPHGVCDANGASQSDVASLVNKLQCYENHAYWGTIKSATAVIEGHEIVGLKNIKYYKSYTKAVAKKYYSAYKKEQKAIKKVKSIKGTRAKVKYINKYLKSICEYDYKCSGYEGSNKFYRWRSRTYFGVYGFGEAVCMGYSDAAKRLMDACGIKNKLVTSSNHRWNKVKVGKSWLHLDVTWNDTARRDGWLLTKKHSN